MVYGIGIDIQNTAAFEVLPEDDVFFKRTFTPAERAAAAARSRPAVYYAERFAAKEAVIKAFHTGTNHLRLSEVETLNEETGAPIVTLHGVLHALALEKHISEVQLSLSFDNGTAAAYALLWAT